MSGPLVSVLIPAYNAADYIETALASVFSQTYESWECIVVDDGSTDATSEVVERTRKARLITQMNSGVSAARNRAASEARGELLAFLDADDVWLPNKLAKQVGLHQASDIHFSYTGLRVVDAQLHKIEDILPPSKGSALRNTLLVERPVVSAAQTVMLTKVLFERLGGFDEELSTSADCDFACRALLEGEGLPVEEVLVLYRLHEGQLHLRPEATLEDMAVVHEKMWADPRLPTHIRKQRRRARANVHVTVAAAYLHNGNRIDFLRHALKALALRADRVAVAAARFVRKSWPRKTQGSSP